MIRERLIRQRQLKNHPSNTSQKALRKNLFQLLSSSEAINSFQVELSVLRWRFRLNRCSFFGHSLKQSGGKTFRRLNRFMKISIYDSMNRELSRTSLTEYNCKVFSDLPLLLQTMIPQSAHRVTAITLYRVELHLFAVHVSPYNKSDMWPFKVMTH